MINEAISKCRCTWFCCKRKDSGLCRDAASNRSSCHDNLYTNTHFSLESKIKTRRLCNLSWSKPKCYQRCEGFATARRQTHKADLRWDQERLALQMAEDATQASRVFVGDRFWRAAVQKRALKYVGPAKLKQSLQANQNQCFSMIVGGDSLHRQLVQQSSPRREVKATCSRGLTPSWAPRWRGGGGLCPKQ